MFKYDPVEKRSSTWKWPVAMAAVLMVLAGIQLFRVNQANEAVTSDQIQIYTPAGPLVNGNIVVRAGDFYSSQIDLNRRSKLAGSFRTPRIQSKVEVLVMTGKDFASWKAGTDFRGLAQTGYVPGGKINVSLEPGTFFLVVDNRENENDQTVDVDFSLER